MIAESIRHQIATGELQPGDRLPAERELVETFGVARMTIRHSLDILQLEGLIERRRGRSGGTFVLAESPLLESVRIEGLTRRVVSSESGVSTKVLSLKQVSAPLLVAGPLEIAEDAAVWELRRLKLQETTPVMLSTHYLPVEIYPTLDERLLSMLSCEMMAKHFGVNPVFFHERVELHSPTPAEQELLGVEEGFVLLKIARKSKSEEGVVLEATEDIIRADMSQLEFIAGIDPTPPKSQLRPTNAKQTGHSQRM